MRRASLRRAGLLTGLVSALAMAGILSGCGDDEKLRITNIDPKTGTRYGGEDVKIRGTGFQGATGVSIYFGDRKVRPQQIIGNREMIVETPPGPANESVDVQIVFDDARTFTYEDGFTYADRSEGFGVNELVTGEAEEGEEEAASSDEEGEEEAASSDEEGEEEAASSDEEEGED